MREGGDGSAVERVERVVGDLFAAIGTRDLRMISSVLHPEVTWQNVPHAPASGRDAVIRMLAPIITWSDRVRWDIATGCYGSDVALLERFDRFWIDGEERTVRCCGVVAVEANLVRAVRDYSDLEEWRTRIDPVYERLARRSPLDVVRRHMTAVMARDPVAMAADYALDATLERGDDLFVGHGAIADYFDTVPDRLGSSTLEFGAVELASDVVRVPWKIGDGSASRATGLDTYVIVQGRIARQTVELSGADF